MAIPAAGKYKYGYVKRSAWEINQAWREKRRQMVKSFQSEASTASSGLMTAISNQITGSATLTSQIALSRVQAQVAAKQAQAQSRVI